MTRWGRLCAAAEAEELLRELRGAADDEDAAYDRAAALKALAAAPPRLWVLLDRAARLQDAAPPAPGGSEPLRLLLAAMDRDGRTRQAAVEELAVHGGPLVASALALRTADWVDQVRDPALAALLRRTAPDEAAAAVRLLLRLRGRSRAAHTPEAYRGVLAAPEARRAVRALAADADPLTRRFGVELALQLGSSSAATWCARHCATRTRSAAGCAPSGCCRWTRTRRGACCGPVRRPCGSWRSRRCRTMCPRPG